jgi:hypothetical protein
VIPVCTIDWVIIAVPQSLHAQTFTATVVYKQDGKGKLNNAHKFQRCSLRHFRL